MGFSYMKSKLGIIYFNNPLSRQFSTAINRGFHSPFFKRSIQVSEFRMLSSVACLYSLQKINSGLLVYTGRRLIHSNASNRVPCCQLDEQLARNRKYGFRVYYSIAFIVLVASLQLVPYSNRIHVVIRSDKLENCIGWRRFRNMIEEERTKILSPNSPEGVRVNAILRNIIQAMHDSLGLKKDCRVSVFDPEHKNENYDSIPKAIGSILFNRNNKNSVNNGSHNSGALLVSSRQMSTSQSTKMAQISPKKLTKFFYGTKHLEGLDWEVMVVDSCSNYEYIANGKIIFNTGSFERKSDEEIATTLAHEVGHGVGRHRSDSLVRAFWLTVFSLLCIPLMAAGPLAGRGVGHIVCSIFGFFSRRRELEADYIGLMLMAAAGYDPRGAPDFYKKLSESGFESSLPTGEKRAKKLEKVMKVAMEIYEQSKANQSITIFNESS